MQWASRQKGFTIVELLIVVVVIAILAAITIVAYNGITNRTKDSAAQTSLNQASKKLATYYLQNADTFPATLGDVGLSGSGGTVYEYTANNVSQVKNYCITATNGTYTYHVAGVGSLLNKTVVGPCPGHAGNQAPLKGDCPAGYITVPGSSLYNTDSFCVMKYEAKSNSGVAVSTAAGTPWGTITHVDAVTKGTEACTGCHLISNNEWMTIAQNAASVSSNWTSGTVGTGSLYTGHTSGSPANAVVASTDDNAGYDQLGVSSGITRRTLTLTNGQVIWDFAGNQREYVQDLITGNQPGVDSPTWQDWHTVTNVGGYASLFPVYANPNAGSWLATQNIGRLYSDASQPLLRALQRGGARGDGNNAGAFSLIINIGSSTANANVGFRVAK